MAGEFVSRREPQRSPGSGRLNAKFFAAEAERMGVHVAGLENRLAEFKTKNPGKLPDLKEVNMKVMDRTESDIQNIERQMQALRRERVFLVARLQQARSAGPETANCVAGREYSRKSIQYDQSHPDMITLRRQIDQCVRAARPEDVAACAIADSALDPRRSKSAIQRGSSGRQTNRSQHRVPGGTHRFR